MVAGLFAGLLLTCSFLRYPLILWITVLPPLSELVPLAAAERPSAASQWARKRKSAQYANRLSPRVGRFINADGTTGFPTGKRAVSATQLMWVSSLIRHPRLYNLCFSVLYVVVELWADNNFTQETAMTMITPSLHACRSTLEDPRVPSSNFPRMIWWPHAHQLKKSDYLHV
jgi:hypothetical protein